MMTLYVYTQWQTGDQLAIYLAQDVCNLLNQNAWIVSGVLGCLFLKTCLQFSVLGSRGLRDPIPSVIM